MSCMDPVDDARALAGQRFPGALAAFLGGSVLSPWRTATSDLDIVIILAGPPAPYRESLRWRGWPVDTFVHDAASLEHYFAKDAARRRPTLARMCSDGAILAGSQRDTDMIRQRARQVIAAGPPPLSAPQLDWARYGLTDTLDDLAGSTDRRRPPSSAGRYGHRPPSWRLPWPATGRAPGSGCCASCATPTQSWQHAW
jgi:hypothetical protein